MGVVASTIDHNLDKRFGAFAIACNLLGQRQGYVVQRSFERSDVYRAGHTAGEHDGRVAGGSVGIYRDAVERAVDDAAKDGVERRGVNVGVGEHERDERGHVWLDHANAFGDSDNHSAGTGDSCRCNFLDGVGGHDAGGYSVSVVARKRQRQGR